MLEHEALLTKNNNNNNNNNSIKQVLVKAYFNYRQELTGSTPPDRAFPKIRISGFTSS